MCERSWTQILTWQVLTDLHAAKQKTDVNILVIPPAALLFPGGAIWRLQPYPGAMPLAVVVQVTQQTAPHRLH